MWKHAGAYMKRKGLKRPGEFRKDNQHGGKLYASRKECQMTDKIAGEIVERVYESKKVTIRQLMQVRHSLSYSYYLKTGTGGDNWPEVKSQWRSFKLASLPKTTRSLKPTRIPTPHNIKAAFTKPWTPDCGMSLAEWTVGLLSSWDFHVFGMRPNVDLDKLKKSTNHDVNPNEFYGRTEMINGRSKLHLQHRGTREWWCYRVCTCEGLTHKSPTKRQMRVNKEGYPLKAPTWCTECPINAMIFVKHHQRTQEWRVYPKWTAKGVYGKQNYGDVQGLANDWLRVQGQEADEEGRGFDKNCGRKALARWLEHLQIPYRESVNIHGDLEDVWRHAYQGHLNKSNYRVREQARDPDVASTSLRLLAKWLREEGDPKKPDLKEKLQDIIDGLNAL